MLADLGDTGSGSVELRIERVSEARRIFDQLGEWADAAASTASAFDGTTVSGPAIGSSGRLIEAGNGWPPMLPSSDDFDFVPGTEAIQALRGDKYFNERLARRLEEDEPVLRRLALGKIAIPETEPEFPFKVEELDFLDGRERKVLSMRVRPRHRWQAAHAARSRRRV
ncbi:MAG TPA: hypothetical protein VFJ57_09815 [Solirubrobacterales bacterium]|nr:hypothetical protein [Solirubrobacterales bacterium]